MVVGAMILNKFMFIKHVFYCKIYSLEFIELKCLRLTTCNNIGKSMIITHSDIKLTKLYKDWKSFWFFCLLTKKYFCFISNVVLRIVNFLRNNYIIFMFHKLKTIYLILFCIAFLKKKNSWIYWFYYTFNPLTIKHKFYKF